MSFDLTNKNIQDTFQNLLQKTGSEGKLFDLKGNEVRDLTIDGTLTVNSYITSESIVNTSSGSTAFGNSSDDSHTFQGNITASGNISSSGDGIFNSVKLDAGDASNMALDFDTPNPTGLYYDGTNFVFRREGSTALSFTPGNIIFGGGGNSKITAVTNTSLTLRGGTTNTVFNTAGINTEGSITASGNISASGDVYADNLYIDGTKALSTSGTELFIGGNVNTWTELKYGREVSDNHLFNGTLNINDPSKIQLHPAGHITASGNISASGNVITNTGSFNEINIPADNQFIKVGASGDLQLYHNGSNSYIDDTGTGDLRLRGSERVRLQGMTGTNMVVAKEGAQVALYHNNVEKLATTTTGINVTGNIIASGNISASGVIHHNVHTFTDGDTTPSVSGGTTFKTANTGGTDITGFDNGTAGQIIYIMIQDNNTDFTDGTNLQLFGGLDHDTAQTNDTISFICVDGTKWCELNRSDNT